MGIAFSVAVDITSNTIRMSSSGLKHEQQSRDAEVDSDG